MQLSTSEARALTYILSGFSLATNSILKVAKLHPFLWQTWQWKKLQTNGDNFEALRVDIPTLSGTAERNTQYSYLDTTTMKMLYNPLFFPDNDIIANYSSETYLSSYKLHQIAV